MAPSSAATTFHKQTVEYSSTVQAFFYIRLHDKYHNSITGSSPVFAWRSGGCNADSDNGGEV